MIKIDNKEIIENSVGSIKLLESLRDKLFFYTVCEKKGKILSNRKDLKLPCQCKCFLNGKMPNLNGKLCTTFGHCYCQGLLGYIPSDFAKKYVPNIPTKNIPNFHVCRLMLRLMAWDSISQSPHYSIMDAVLSIFAWGGKTVLRHHNAWSKWLSIQENRTELEEALKTQSISLKSVPHIDGIAISFMSKILFFFDKGKKNYILDKNVKSAIKGLFGKNFDAYNYDKYNQFLITLTSILKLTSPELTEILLWHYQIASGQKAKPHYTCKDILSGRNLPTLIA